MRLLNGIKTVVMVGMASLACPAWAVQGDIVWSSFFGGDSTEEARAITPTRDGGYVLAGFTNSFGSSGFDMYAARINSTGGVLWQRAYGGAGTQHAYAVTVTEDSCFIVAGNASLPTNGYTMYVVKIDEQGDVLWEHTYGINNGGVARAVLACEDGSVLLAGNGRSPHPTEWGGMYLVKIDPDGNVIWEHSYGISGDIWAEACYDIAPSDDGGYHLGGYRWTTENWSHDMALVKVNTQGEMLWMNGYGGAYDQLCYGIIPSGDGGVWMVGGSDLFKVNSQGQLVLTYIYPTNNYFYDIGISTDGNLLLAGYEQWYGDCKLTKITLQGDILWQGQYGGGNIDKAWAVMCNSVGNYLLAGSTFSFGNPVTVNVYAVCVEGIAIPSVEVSAVPDTPPVIIPTGGGVFTFTSTLTNNDSTAVSIDIWSKVRLPNQALYGPLLGPAEVTVPAGGALLRMRNQTVPASAPSGDYWYQVYAGAYPLAVWDSSGFSFTKMGSYNTTGPVDGWTCCDLETDISAQATQSEETITGCIRPNPFNSRALIRYTVPSAGFVTVSVFDLNGRQINRIVNEWKGSGEYLNEFYGGNLPSGIYFVEIREGNHRLMEKLVLLK